MGGASPRFFSPWPAYIGKRNVLYCMVFNVLGVPKPFENLKSKTLSLKMYTTQAPGTLVKNPGSCMRGLLGTDT